MRLLGGENPRPGDPRQSKHKESVGSVCHKPRSREKIENIGRDDEGFMLGLGKGPRESG